MKKLILVVMAILLIDQKICASEEYDKLPRATAPSDSVVARGEAEQAAVNGGREAPLRGETQAPSHEQAAALAPSNRSTCVECLSRHQQALDDQKLLEAQRAVYSKIVMDKLLQDGIGGNDIGETPECINGYISLPRKIKTTEALKIKTTEALALDKNFAHRVRSSDLTQTECAQVIPIVQATFFIEQLGYLQRARESGLLLDMSAHLELLKHQKDEIEPILIRRFSKNGGTLKITSIAFHGWGVYSLSSVRRSKGDYTHPTLEVLTSGYSQLLKEKLDHIRALHIGKVAIDLSRIWTCVKDPIAPNSTGCALLPKKCFITKNMYYSEQLDCLDEACRSRLLSAEEMNCLHNYIAYNYYADLENILGFSGFSFGEDKESFLRKYPTHATPKTI